MKEFFKDYGSAIGPCIAFLLGIIAIYLKAVVDRSIEERKTNKKLSNLISLIKNSTPPPKYYPKISEDGFLHADQARNLTNFSIFAKRLNAIIMFIDKIEDDVIANCSNSKIQQFHHIKFIASYLNENVKEIQDKKEDHNYENFKFSFSKISRDQYYATHTDYERLVDICQNPEKHFNYITG
ncbi:hypothetical protein HUW51_13315 [Adhaeribacter swui]|uniref:DUF4760 domain-containing protein n=1 Tax=Adhaeribacter swui TaxID=2086471 RepID=A0A7G7G919_9BACT|nr:hypothetical protein [Adhaeribacter swui]QNF33653.1 hypothetical protein HUW51_13315 [Adhaeribacter swui]